MCTPFEGAISIAKYRRKPTCRAVLLGAATENDETGGARTMNARISRENTRKRQRKAVKGRHKQIVGGTAGPYNENPSNPPILLVTSTREDS